VQINYIEDKLKEMHPTTVEELQKVLKGIKGRIVTRSDCINSELLKFGGISI
jgi:hypothetical protein